MATKLALTLSALFQKLIDSPNTQVRVWEGKVDVINRTTQEKTGKSRITANLDIVITPGLYEKAQQHLDLEDKDGSWIEITVFGKKMVLIKLREDKTNERLIAQFTVPNQGNWVNVANAAFATNFEEIFAKANKTVEGKVEEKKEKKPASADIDADEFERLMKS